VPPPGSPSVIDRDLHCSACGYNLRGLSGDPVACPECGADTPLSDETRRSLAATDARRRELRRRHELGPSLCAIAVGGAVSCFGVFALRPDFFRPNQNYAYGTCALIWGMGAALHVAHSGRSSDWLSCFWRHQIYAVLAVLASAAILFGVFLAVALLLGKADGPPCCLICTPFLGVLGLLYFRPARWFSRRATAELEPLVEQAIMHDGRRR
jgi:hypothetical protein